MATDPREVRAAHDATFAPATGRGAKMPPIDPTLVGAAFAHEPAIGSVADAPVEMATEPKLKIDATQKSTREFLKSLTFAPITSSLKPKRPTGRTGLTIQHFCSRCSGIQLTSLGLPCPSVPFSSETVCADKVVN